MTIATRELAKIVSKGLGTDTNIDRSELWPGNEIMQEINNNFR